MNTMKDTNPIAFAVFCILYSVAVLGLAGGLAMVAYALCGMGS